MSNVWQTRHRLLLEQLNELANQLNRNESGALPALNEQTVRLLSAAITLLRQHQVNNRGQCQYCKWTRWTWRFWRRRPPCTVYRSLDFAMRQPLDVVSLLLSEDSVFKVSAEAMKVRLDTLGYFGAAPRPHETFFRRPLLPDEALAEVSLAELALAA